MFQHLRHGGFVEASAKGQDAHAYRIRVRGPKDDESGTDLRIEIDIPFLVPDRTFLLDRKHPQVRELATAVNALTIPARHQYELMGLDGVDHQLRIHGLGLELSVEWWCEPPESLRDAARVATLVLEVGRAAAAGSEEVLRGLRWAAEG